MKKVLLVLAVSAFFVACNDSSTSSSDVSKDSTTVSTDSSSMMTAPVDTTKKDTSHMMSTDTMMKK